MEKRGRKRKGLSPIITTVLLVAIVIIIAVIIFMWARGFIKEIVEKDIGGVKKSAEKFCADVNFIASVDRSMGSISVVNRGNVPIYRIDVKQEMSGKSKIEQIDFEGGGLNKGESTTEELTLNSATTSLKIIPVLLGKSGNKKKEFICSDTYAVELDV